MCAPPPDAPQGLDCAPAAAAEDRSRLAAEAAGVGTFDFDPVSGVLFWDERLKALFGLPPDAPVDYDAFLSVTHPDDRERAHGVVARALDPDSGADGEYAVEFRPAAPAADGGERWVLARGRAYFDPERTRAVRFVGTVLDVTERRRAEEGLQRELQLRDAITSTAADALFVMDAKGRITFANPAAEQMFGWPQGEMLGRVLHDLIHHHRPDGTPFPFGECPLGEVMRSGGTLRSHEDTFFRRDGSTVPVQCSNAPLASGGVITGAVLVVSDISERKRADAERERLLARERARAERERAHAAREAVLARIGSAVRSSLPPTEVQAVAVEALGHALGVDRCYFSTVDAERDQTVIGRDFHAEGVPSFTGSYRLSDFDVDVARVFVGGRTVVVADTQDIEAARAAGLPWSERTAATLAGMRVRALVNVPFLDPNGRVVAALGAAMADAPRSWTHEEVAFIERVATETREAMDAIRRQQRERNIAEQLQEVLTPPTPPHLPGLSLASYYRPALAEAGVGGDFFDVFAVEEGCTALVVADLSGKGLAAAQQVATVRNMLRFALYNGHSVFEAVSRLNKSLVEHDLLAGFATLFVGLYDHARRTITYVNCGQEPGLIWRAATDGVEQLRPTGPVLGGFGEGEFEQDTVPLRAGDVLALFTDGLTEVGPSRKQLLEAEGVADLLRDCCSHKGLGDADPEEVVGRLISGVDAFARGGLRDDIALLVGVVGGVAAAESAP